MLSNQELSAILDVGEAMLTYGGEVSRIEQTVSKMCMAYGAERVDAFSITSSMIVTVRLPGEEVLTQTRRIREWAIDYGRLAELDELAGEIAEKHLNPKEIGKRLEKAKTTSEMSGIYTYVGSVLAAGGFAMFFGGSFRDGISAAILALVFTLIDRKVNHAWLNRIAYSFITSFVSGMIAIGMVEMGVGEHLDKIMIGGIMLVIPGIALANAVRDLLLGDVITGLLRLCESLLIAAGVAAGFAAALFLGRGWL
ncbi:MAG: threonine/serine exporter family protein [Lachnospiraceae bacterium]|nr:threonine/serine exporter family protein [Lachnospiraceae bacterium]